MVPELQGGQYIAPAAWMGFFPRFGLLLQEWASGGGLQGVSCLPGGVGFLSGGMGFLEVQSGASVGWLHTHRQVRMLQS